MAKGLLDMLEHRGPDAEGFWQSEDRRLILGHRRLKILDLSDSANQPMVSPCKRWILIFNGEIVNYRTLRAKYRGSWQFRTSGDTELLLALLSERGIDALHDCVGMFSFALFDTHLQKLTLVRDRFGIKPLYIVRLQDGAFAFASEIPPLLKLQQSVRPDLDVIRTYLETSLYEMGSRTFFEGVESVPSGGVMEIDLDKGAWRTNTWYDLSECLPDFSGIEEEALLEEGAQKIEQAISEHLVADVRTGLNVSGGVDSSTLASVARRHVQNIHLFTQDYESPYSEAEWVRQVADGLPLHLEQLTETKIRGVLNQTVHVQAEPYGGVFVAGYDYLYQAATREGVTVLLDGNGIDEVFLGYKKYHAAAVRHARDAQEWEKLAKGYQTFWQSTPPRRGEEQGQHQAIDGSEGARPQAVSDGLRRKAKLLYPPNFSGKYADPVRAMAAQDLLGTKIPRGLRFNDRMSMAHSKELRVPFLDHRLVEFGFALPSAYLLNDQGSKALFRKIIARWVPEPVANAVKRSVQSPQREWLARPWRGMVEDVLTSDRFASRDWVDPKTARQIYAGYLNGNQENSFFIWQWLNLEWWARVFLDGERAN